MGNLREITPYELQDNFFRRIGHDWMLVGAKKENKVNMMTASWGGTGILWNKPVVYVFIRPQRYTKLLVDAVPTFSLSFLPDGYKDQLTLCGSKSGRDMDKVEACGFHVTTQVGAPVFQESQITLICEKLYRQTLTPESFLKEGIDSANYPGKDYHDMYVAEILKVLVQE